MPKLTGDELLERLESGLIDPDNLTTKQREQVLYAQKDELAMRREQMRSRKGRRTRFGLGSWKYPNDRALEKTKGKSKKLRM